MFDLKEYARKLRENAITDDNGIVKVSPELWEQIAGVIEWAADKWISVNDRLPEAEKEVLILCKASYGKNHRYQCIAFYEPKGMLREQSDYGWDYECCSEYSEEDDDYFVNEGWYERIHNWDEYSAVGIVDEVTHWTPLLAVPKEETEAADCVADACPLTGCGCGEADE